VYYRGDYVPSGYYRGDPWVGAVLGGVARSVGLGKAVARAGRWVAGRITGTTVKRAAQAVGGIAATTVVGTAVSRAINPSQPVSIDDLDMGGGGGGGGVMQGGGGGGSQWVMTASGRRMRVRWSQSKGKWVAVRSMNPLNPKALNRSLRRATGFEKFAKKTMNALYKTSGGARVRKFKKK